LARRSATARTSLPWSPPSASEILRATVSADAWRKRTVEAAPLLDGRSRSTSSAARRSTLSRVSTTTRRLVSGWAVSTPSFDTSGCKTGTSETASPLTTGRMRVTS
jgi:hypothetical protein